MDTEGNLAQVRDLLVGPQMRVLEQRIDRIDARLDQELTSLREEMGKNTGQLESLIKTQIAAVNEQLKTERGQRSTTEKGVHRELRELQMQLEKRAKQLDERVSKSDQLLRELVAGQLQTLRDEVEEAQTAISEDMQKSLGEVQTAKVDRTALGEMLHELAQSIGGEAPKKNANTRAR